jgi:hypothetical protein
MMTTTLDFRKILQSMEPLSKRLRKMEVLPRTSASEVYSFLSLLDTPDSYSGHAGWTSTITGAEDGLEFQPFTGSCVTFVCGPVGWRGTGGTDPRTLIHEEAFQLSDFGNDRGNGAIDLQKESTSFPLDTHVAGSEFSVILSGRKNSIEPIWSSTSGIRGDDNSIDEGYGTQIIGDFNRLFPDLSNVTVFGSSNDVDFFDYVFMMGSWSDIYGGFGAVVFGEGNVIDGCTYSGTLGLDNSLDGYNWGVYLLGENCEAYGSSADFYHRNYFSMVHGLHSYIENVNYNFVFGQVCKSRETDATGLYFFDSRMVLNGDEPNSYVSDGSSKTGGFNQVSWFSQEDFIQDWAVAWTTSRFQFPLIQESMWGFVAYISGVEQGCANVFRWKLEGAIKNAGGVTTLAWSAVTNQYRDVATKEWQVIADNVNDRLVFQFRDTAGPDTEDCMIQFSMRTFEVGFD